MGVYGMGIKIGYSSASYERAYKQLVCSHCGELLGSYERIEDKEYNDIEGWNYCPYCGSELR
jgi:DNA-directed RNA polymerase subunit RPC12/RpoP